MKNVIIVIIVISNLVCLGQNEGLSVTDFKFDGPLGCEGVKIEKIAKNHFKLIPGHAPGHVNWLLKDENNRFLDKTIIHFVFMMSPDAPSKGWYRTNAQGVDGNRSYFSDGANIENQAHEAYVCQKDLEELMKSSKPVTDIWSMHTWQGAVEPIMIPGPEIGEEVGEWTKLRKIIIKNDKNLLIEPLRIDERPEEGNKAYWTHGPYSQFGITAVLCEGAGNFYTKEMNLESGEVLMKSILEFYE